VGHVALTGTWSFSSMKYGKWTLKFRSMSKNPNKVKFLSIKGDGKFEVIVTK
jgi:hypothetical protein